MSEALRTLHELVRQMESEEEQLRAVPAPTPPQPPQRVCIGMATYDDFDGVYFTVQSLRLHHPEVLGQVEFLVIDNHPEGPDSAELKALDAKIPHYRYVPFRGYHGTAVRELLFRWSEADIVVCMDSHVLLRPGALRTLIEHFDANPSTRDMIQGPLLNEDHVAMATHMAPEWGGGMFGTWADDPRGADPSSPAFEIPMQGLGVFACRRDAWPGFNPRFRGFGGEEGYVHEKVRRNGGRVLCLPALGWLHRFSRTDRVPSYNPTWGPRVRNYVIAREELGEPIDDLVRHLSDELGDAAAGDLVAAARRDLDNPFTYFDSIFCINLDRELERWKAMRDRFSGLGIAWRVERFSAIETQANHHRGCALSFRAVLAEARRRSLEHVLIFEDDCMFHKNTLTVVGQAVADIRERDWDVLFLGASVHGRDQPRVAGSTVLRRPNGVTCMHAVAFHRRCFDRLLAEIPAADDDVFDEWIAHHGAIDQYVPARVADGTLRGFIVEPRVATQPALLQYEDSDKALAAHFAG